MAVIRTCDRGRVQAHQVWLHEGRKPAQRNNATVKLCSFGESKNQIKHNYPQYIREKPQVNLMIN